MEEDDARRLSPNALEQMRRHAIVLRKQGKGPTEIGRILGVRRHTVSSWWKSYEAEGVRGLKPAKRGVDQGTNRTLSSEQEVQLQQVIIDMTPDQLELSLAL